MALPLLTPLLALWTGHLKGTPCQGHPCRNPIISIGLGFEVGWECPGHERPCLCRAEYLGCCLSPWPLLSSSIRQVPCCRGHMGTLVVGGCLSIPCELVHGVWGAPGGLGDRVWETAGETWLSGAGAWRRWSELDHRKSSGLWEALRSACGPCWASVSAPDKWPAGGPCWYRGCLSLGSPGGREPCPELTHVERPAEPVCPCGGWVPPAGCWP